MKPQLRSPTTCCLHTGDQEKWAVSFWDLRARLKMTHVQVWVWSPENYERALLQAGKDQRLSPRSQAENSSNLTLAFCSSLDLSRLVMMPTHVEKGHLLCSVYPFKCSSLPETPSQTQPKIMFNWCFGHHQAHSARQIKLFIAAIKSKNSSQKESEPN